MARTRADLAGHRFPGGVRSIAHWENYLLTEATGRAPMPGDLAHPIHLFHVPIEGVGVTIAGLFALCDAEGPDRVGLRAYDWEWTEPLREDVEYQCEGEILDVRPGVEDGQAYDEVRFRIELSAEGRPVARTTTTWHCWRGDGS